MGTYILQVRFPRRPGTNAAHPIASVRKVVAGSRAEAESIIRAEYERRRVPVFAVRSFGKV